LSLNKIIASLTIFIVIIISGFLKMTQNIFLPNDILLSEN